MDLARKTPACPNLLECGHRPLPAQDSSAPSALGDDAVQRKLRRLLRLGARDRGVASRDDGEAVSPVGHGDGKKTPVVRARMHMLTASPVGYRH